MGRRVLPQATVTWASSLRAGEDEWRVLLSGLAAVYAAGRDIDWVGFDRDYRRRIVTLPSYPFERSPYWFEAGDGSGTRGGATTVDRGHAIARTVVGSPYPTIQARLSADSPDFMSGHKVQGSVVAPGTMMLELMLAASATSDSPELALDDVEFQRALFLPVGSHEIAQAIVTPDSSGRRAVNLFSRTEAGAADWTLRAMSTVGRVEPPGDPAAALVEIEAARLRCTTDIPADGFYTFMAEHGLEYGPSFRSVRTLARHSGECVAFVEATADVAGELGRYRMHPALFDACVQVVAVASQGDAVAGDAGLYLPVGLRRLRVHRPLPARFWVHVTMAAEGSVGSLAPEGDIRVIDEQGNPIVEIDGWRVQQVDTAGTATHQESVESWMYEIDWRPVDAPAPAVEAPAVARSWLVLAGSGSLGHRLAASLVEQGHTARVAVAGDRLETLADGSFTLRTGSRADVEQLSRSLTALEEAPDAIVCLWPIETVTRPANIAPVPAANGSTPATNGRAPTKNGRAGAAAHRNGASAAAATASHPLAVDPIDEVAAAALAVAHLVQGLADAASEHPTRLVLVTRGAEAGLPGGDESSLLQAPVTGLTRVIRKEHPELQPVSVDLDPADDPSEVADLGAILGGLEPLGQPGDETELAIRQGRRLGRRLVPINDPTDSDTRTGSSDEDVISGGLRAPAGAYRLESTAPGMLDKLALRPAQHRSPGPGEVEVQVLAAGVNFRDVMKALGIYPMAAGDVAWLGDEFAGRVVAVGEGVDLAMGQDVFGAGPASFASLVSTRAEYVMPKPASLTFEEAATLPVCFTTALYALQELARLQPGESVLIHAAAGGVGQAAIQVAHSIGAEVYATASEGKRDFVRSLGVTHVFDSRTLSFAEEIRAATGGRGVDVVLNHLAGDFIPASISTLAPYGRFVEIGKRDIFANSKIGLAPFRNNLSFFAVDMDRISRDRPHVYRRLLAEVRAGVDSGRFTPLPRRVFPIDSAVSAFRYLAQARNIGKVVLSLAESPLEMDSIESAFGFRPDATYLVTGGLRGLGGRVAEWMALLGARNLVLLGRDPASSAALETAQRVETAGARVTLMAADVGSPDQVGAVLARIHDSLPPLRGIVHAAGIVADGLLGQMDDDQFRAVFGPKAAGALNLHRATANLDLDFFINFSSTASLLGNPGQSNYAAANAFLDRLAWLRRSQGRAGQTINWNQWSEIGMGAVGHTARTLDYGVGVIPPDRGIEALGFAVQDARPEIAVMPMDWVTFLTRVPGARTDPLLDVIRARTDLDAPEGGQTAGAVRAMLLAAAPEDRQRLVEEFVQTELAKVLELDRDALPLDQPLSTVGLDSLMALELKNRVEVGLAINLPIVSLIQGPSITQLSAELATRLAASEAGEGAAGDGVTGQGAAEGGSAPPTDVEAIPSSEELDAILGRASASRSRA
ncbi:MAG TPA: SDR family NAD(P)-dependent oxidoreductase [Candidatus Saccharimonadales bacterium]|nr:SDR family NAD(P)-dependent oxidoreductase [Candidatus Saccharimonadales bacterium]